MVHDSLVSRPQRAIATKFTGGHSVPCQVRFPGGEEHRQAGSLAVRRAEWNPAGGMHQWNQTV